MADVNGYIASHAVSQFVSLWVIISCGGGFGRDRISYISTSVFSINEVPVILTGAETPPLRVPALYDIDG